jgi:hypothetical protein
VVIIPLEPDGVLPHPFGGNRFGSRLKHGQSTRRRFWRFTRLPPSFVTLFVAHGAGAGVAEIYEAIVRNMAVSPLDVHTRTGRKVDLNRLGIRSRGGRLKRGLHGSSIAQDEAPELSPRP